MSQFNDLFTVTVHVKPTDEELMRLNREATAAKKAKDWPRAVECLRLAIARTGETSSLRLALFLQQAGRFDEAMAEFNLLLSDVKPRIGRELAHAGPYARRSSVACDLMRIYDKIRLACQREKRLGDADRYAGLYEQHRVLWGKLKPLAHAERKKKFEDREKARK